MDSDFQLTLICSWGTDVGIGHCKRLEQVGTALARIGMADQKLIRIVNVGQKCNELGCRLVKDLNQIISEEIEEEAGCRGKIVILDIRNEACNEQVTESIKKASRTGVIFIGIDYQTNLSPWMHLVWLPCFMCEETIQQKLKNKVVYGWDCYLFNSMIVENWKIGNKVLVLTGGADVTGLGETLPGQLDEGLGSGFEITWVKGPLAKPPKLPQKPLAQWKVNDAPENIWHLLNETTMVVSVYGISVFEALACQRPVIVLDVYGKRDIDELNKLESMGLVITCAHSRELAGLIRMQMGNKESLDKQSKRMAQIKIGGGAELLAGRIRYIASQRVADSPC